MINDSNFPNGVCKKCHFSVEVLIRKMDLKQGDIRYECKNCGYVSIKL
ncbi:MAG: hypothetical protein ACKO7N_07835 [Candidatus Nitrosotenuis sp.]